MPASHTGRTLLLLFAAGLAASGCSARTGGNGGDDDDGGPHEATIPELQRGAFAPGTRVVVQGVVVTGVGYSAASGSYIGLYVQEPEGGPESGIWVYTATGADEFERRDVVDVVGYLTEYDAAGDWAESVTEINVEADDDGSVTDTGVDRDLPEPGVLASADFLDSETMEPWEGALVRLDDVEVDDPDLGYGEWSVVGGAIIDDRCYDWASANEPLQPGAGFASITGALDWSFGAWKLHPRDAADFVGYVPGGG